MDEDTEQQLNGTEALVLIGVSLALIGLALHASVGMVDAKYQNSEMNVPHKYQRNQFTTKTPN